MVKMVFDVEIDLPDTKTLLKGLGLDAGGKVQEFFSEDIKRRSDKRAPFGTGTLKNSAMLDANKDAIVYAGPQARYLWYGKLMVDPITGKGSFFDPLTGRHWSRPETQKILTDIDLNYKGAPMRGAKWVDRTWIEEGRETIISTEKYIEKVSQFK